MIEHEGFKVSPAGTTEQVPIHSDADGVIRISGTRVTLDTIVAAFENGATAEEIAQQYPSVGLADVYAVIAYYLHHRPEIRSYLHQRAQHSARVREENERRFDPSGVRDRLLARRRYSEPVVPRMAADEHFNNDIVRGVLRRQPDLDIVRIQDAGLSGYLL